MFDRYTEPARRVIFFARLYAGEAGGEYIEAEHILRGLIHVFHGMASFLPQELESLRAELETAPGPGPARPAHEDMPLSRQARNILSYTARESKDLGHHSIDCQHLLLGLLRVPGSRAARLLAAHGLTIQAARALTAELHIRRDKLHRLVDELPESAVEEALRALRKLQSSAETMEE